MVILNYTFWYITEKRKEKLWDTENQPTQRRTKEFFMKQHPGQKK